MRLPTCVAVAMLVVGAATTPARVAFGQPAEPDTPAEDEHKAFERRLAALKRKFETFDVRMRPTDDPRTVPSGAGPTGPVLVSGQRLGLYTPPVLSPEDVQLVIQQNMADVRACYKKQLRRDPEWSDQLILDLAIKRSGRVSEVGVAPGRVRRAVIGQCLVRLVPRWRFPPFTGEMGDGVTQEVLNASFPFNFSPR